MWDDLPSAVQLFVIIVIGAMLAGVVYFFQDGAGRDK